MEIVNELKNLLNLNLAEVGITITGNESLNSVNSQSEKFNSLVEAQLNKKCETAVSSQTAIPANNANIDDEVVFSQFNDLSIKSFDDLLDKKLKITDPRFRPPPVSEIVEKKPFLKKGQGLRRFSRGEIDFTTNESSESVEPKPRDDKHVKPTSKKVICLTKSREHRPSITKKPTKRLQLDNISEKCAAKPLEDKNISTESTITESRSISYSSHAYAIELMKQIEVYEKRLDSLIQLKKSINQIDYSSDSCESENIISSLDCIKGEICRLNDKITHLSNGKCGEKDDNEAVSGGDNRLEALNDNGENVELPNVRHGPESTHYTLPNGDKITTFSDKSMVFEYTNGTTQTVSKDGLRIVKFPNGQIEKMHVDGSKQIIYPDGQQRVIKSDKSEEIRLTNGTVHFITNGMEKIQYSNGNTATVTKNYTRKEYKDGTIKTVFTNGCVETVFATGRVRFKNKTGAVIYDQIP